MDNETATVGLSALANPIRLNVFRYLVRSGPEGAAAGAIADDLDIPPSGLSFHLARLEAARLVRARRRGRHQIYAADFRQMGALISYLTDECCDGRPELCLPGPSAATTETGET